MHVNKSELNSNSLLPKSELDLIESKEIFRYIFDYSIIGKSITTLEGKLSVNKAFCNILGYTESELNSLNWRDITFKDDIELNEQIVNKIINGNRKSDNWEKRFIHKDGHIVWVNISTTLLSDEKGQPLYFISEIIDISQRKTTEAELKKSEEKFKKAFMTSPDSITINRLEDGVYVSVNKSFTRIIGYTEEDVLGKTSLEKNIWVNLNDRQKLLLEIEEKGFVENLIALFRKKNNELVCGMVSASIIELDGVKHILNITRDITDQKNAENALFENRNFLKKLVDESISLISSDFEAVDYTKITETARQISGAKYAVFNQFESNGLDFKTEAFCGLPEIVKESRKYLGFDLLAKKWNHDAERAEKIKDKNSTVFPSFHALVGHVLPTSVISLVEKVFNLGETVVVKVDKDQHHLGDFTLIFEKGNTLKSTELLELYASQVALYLERIRTEKELRQREQRYRVLFADNPQPMLVYDLETLKILEVNQTAVDFYEYSRAEFLSMTIKDMHPEDELVHFFYTIEETRHGKNTDGISLHLKKNGEKVYTKITSTSAPIFGKNARHVLIEDITQRLHAENELKSSNSLLNATLESTADGILVVDNKGFAVICNQKFVDMWQIPQHLLAKRIDELMLRYVQAQTKNPENFLFRVGYLNQHPALTSVDEIPLADGRIFERYSVPQRIGDEIIGRVWSFRDITERRMAEEELKVSELRYRTFINSTPDLVFIKDEELRHLTVNKALCNFYRKSETEIIGKTDFELSGNEILAGNCRLSDLESLKTNDIVKTEEEIDHQVYETIKFPFEFQKGKRGVGGYIRDITQRKQAEENLRVKMEELQRFQNLTVDREMRMIELKKEINELALKLGEKERYVIVG